MLKEAIEKIVSLSAPQLKEVEGRTYCLTADSTTELRPTIDFPSGIVLNSLDGLTKMIQTEALKLYEKPLYLTVPSPILVQCFGQPDSIKRYIRTTYYRAEATDVPGWGERVELKFEEAMIALRTRFQETPDTLYALRLLSDITTGAKVTYTDNGIATSVVTKTGVALQNNEAIRPIIKLKPYRTFQEVEQPESQFLIRINERGIQFIEADGGMWKLKARLTIKKYLEEALEKEVRDNLVVVAP